MNALQQTYYYSFGKKGYKCFSKTKEGTLYCRQTSFEPGKKYSIDNDNVIRTCHNGFHFCSTLVGTRLFYWHKLSDYFLRDMYEYAEVKGSGDMDYDDFPEKYASRHLKIVKVLSKEEVFELLFPKEKRVYRGLEYFNAAYYGSNPITGGLEKQKIKRIITFEEFIKRHENINPIFFNEIYEIVSK